MRQMTSTKARHVALTAALASGAILLGIGLPTRAQQNLPAASVQAPAASSGPDTRVSLTYSLPAGVRLQRNPVIVVIDPQGRLFAFHPVHIAPGAAASTGYRDLPTELYPPGTYQVHVQLDYTTPDGKSATFTSPSVPLVVPAR
jgi:hypothetical protein